MDEKYLVVCFSSFVYLIQATSPNYKRYVDEAIEVSSKLTDHDKLISELYIDKVPFLLLLPPFRRAAQTNWSGT
jgi:hypothetical protein